MMQPKKVVKKPMIQKVGHGILNFGRDFCLETSIHGFNHIAVPGRHWFERSLWALLTAAAIWGAIYVGLGQLQRYNESPTVVTLEKDFRSWSSPLPGITLCNADRVNATKLPEVIKSYWNVEESSPNYTYYSDFVHTVANSDYFNMNNYTRFAKDVTLEVDLYQLVVDVMPTPNITSISSMGVDWLWIPVMTESGACHTTNSMATPDIAIVSPDRNETTDLPIRCKYSSAVSCFVEFEVLFVGNYYVHSPYDIADMAEKPLVFSVNLKKTVEYSIMELRCGPGVRQLSVARRRCLYVDEPVSSYKKVYSTNMCRRSCRNRIAIKACGCRPFYNQYEDGAPCTAAGMACLSQHVGSLFNISYSGIKCACMLQCLDAVYKELTNQQLRFKDGPYVAKSIARFVLQTPRVRYTREIVFHFQDLVVSFGGAAGLFLGASFLSFVEVFHFVVEKIFKFCTEPYEQEQNIKSCVPLSKRSYEEDIINQLTNVLEQPRSVFSRPF